MGTDEERAGSFAVALDGRGAATVSCNRVVQIHSSLFILLLPCYYVLVKCLIGLVTLMSIDIYHIHFLCAFLEASYSHRVVLVCGAFVRGGVSIRRNMDSLVS